MKKAKIYEQIFTYLKNAIKIGELKIGEAIYSEPELCKKFNVSRTSVRKAIRKLVAENLLVSKQGIGTFVKGTGSGLIYNSICLINHHTRILCYDIADTHYMDGIFGVEAEVTNQKMDFQVFSGVLKSPEELVSLKQHKVDGLIVDEAFLNYGFDLEIFNQITPHIVILKGNPKVTKLPCIVPDYEDGFKQIIDLLGKKQLSNSLYLHESVSSDGQYKLAEFKRTLKVKHCPSPEFVDYSENMSLDNFGNIDHYTLIFKALEKYLGSPSFPSCIIAAHDHAAVKAMNVVKQHHMQVPGDIGIVGFNNMNIATMVVPAITSVNVNMRQMGGMAVKFLLDLIHGKTDDVVRQIPVQLLERKSHKSVEGKK
jgi:GntR family transcriptional regulator, arabinose operon transcriptional repressor